MRPGTTPAHPQKAAPDKWGIDWKGFVVHELVHSHKGDCSTIAQLCEGVVFTLSLDLTGERSGLAITVVPIILIVALFSRYIVSGIAKGSIEE
jgi:ABC-type glycerol-3-phosphate transport system permease component